MSDLRRENDLVAGISLLYRAGEGLFEVRIEREYAEAALRILVHRADGPGQCMAAVLREDEWVLRLPGIVRQGLEDEAEVYNGHAFP